jgi:histidinol-phosphate/aromatic aminotransferase/cobyric acid decarboxylase-like protein
LRDALRISIGTPAEMNALFKAIAANLSALNLNGPVSHRKRR